jgi:hypothetical protein
MRSIRSMIVLGAMFGEAPRFVPGLAPGVRS